jgi:Rrf2 family iron-sulfur cluster assembly transcriptional regulator
MMLTTKGRYAVMAVVSLANLSKNGRISLSVVAEHQNIPLNYLEQIFSKLKSNGIVSASKGPGGGYYLTRNELEISIYDIINAVEENTELVRCGHKKNGGCMPSSKKCMTHDLWSGLEETIVNYLKSKSLADISR